MINAVLSDPWIAARIRHDSREPSYIEHPNLSYFAGYDDGRLAGIFTAIRHSAWEIEVHAALGRHAIRRGRVLGREFLAELWRDPELLRITAPVLSTLPSAVNYCRRLGFVDEGVKRRACRQNGVAIDVVYLGMTWADWGLSTAIEKGDDCEGDCGRDDSAGQDFGDISDHIGVRPDQEVLRG